MARNDVPAFEKGESPFAWNGCDVDCLKNRRTLTGGEAIPASAPTEGVRPRGAWSGVYAAEPERSTVQGSAIAPDALLARRARFVNTPG